MPPAVAAAGISAAGTVAGGVVSGKGASKAAAIQAKSAADQLAFQKQMYGDDVARYQPDIARGDTAATNYSALLGLGGDQKAADDAFATWKAGTGYQNTLNAALDGVNASAYASGMGRSGAALKALQDRAGQVADGTYNSYMGDLSNVVQTGANAKASLTGASTSAVSQNAATTSNAANASSNAALSSAASTSSALQSLGQLGAYAYNSSFGTPAKIGTTSTAPVVINNAKGS